MGVLITAEDTLPTRFKLMKKLKKVMIRCWYRYIFTQIGTNMYIHPRWQFCVGADNVRICPKN